MTDSDGDDYHDDDNKGDKTKSKREIKINILFGYEVQHWPL